MWIAKCFKKIVSEGRKENFLIFKTNSMTNSLTFLKIYSLLMNPSIFPLFQVIDTMVETTTGGCNALMLKSGKTKQEIVLGENEPTF